MTPDQVRLVQTSFAVMRPWAGDFVAAFYERLFTLDPALRPLFPAETAEQRRKLVDTLVLIVQAQDGSRQVLKALKDLGLRHARYGVQAKDYDTAGIALQDTLQGAFDVGFDEELRAAWAACYTFVARTMQDAAGQRLPAVYKNGG
jgi:hemoglobin-like flavoprotein